MGGNRFEISEVDAGIAHVIDFEQTVLVDLAFEPENGPGHKVIWVHLMFLDPDSATAIFQHNVVFLRAVVLFPALIPQHSCQISENTRFLRHFLVQSANDNTCHIRFDIEYVVHILYPVFASLVPQLFGFFGNILFQDGEAFVVEGGVLDQVTFVQHFEFVVAVLVGQG